MRPFLQVAALRIASYLILCSINENASEVNQLGI